MEHFTCNKCGENMEGFSKIIHTFNGLRYGPFCDSCYREELDKLYPPSPNAYEDGNASPYDWD